MSEARRLLLAFDFGLKRIGIATGNLLTRTASPLTTLNAGGEPPWAEIDQLMAEWRPDLIVIGDPGAESAPDLHKALTGFVAEVERRYSIETERVDESYTSAAAESALRAGRQEGIYNRRLRKEQIDSHAACLIAEQWMSETLD